MSIPSAPQAAKRACVVCGAQTLKPEERKLTEKKRVKFGVMWLIVTIFTGGLGLIVWLIWPRRKVVVNVDRYVKCTSCGARQA